MPRCSSQCGLHWHHGCGGGHLISGWRQKSYHPEGLLWQHSSGEGEGRTLCFWWVGVKSSSPEVSTDTAGRVRACCCLACMEVPAPSLTFSDIVLGEGCGSSYSLVRVTVYVPTWPLQVWQGKCLAVVEQLLSQSVLSCCLAPLAKGKKGFCWVCVHWYFWVAGFLRIHVWKFEA